MLGTELFWFCIIKGAKLNCARFLSYKVANYGIRVLLFLKQLPDFFLKTAVNSLSDGYGKLEHVQYIYPSFMHVPASALFPVSANNPHE